MNSLGQSYYKDRCHMIVWGNQFDSGEMFLKYKSYSPCRIWISWIEIWRNHWIFWKYKQIIFKIWWDSWGIHSAQGNCRPVYIVCRRAPPRAVAAARRCRSARRERAARQRSERAAKRCWLFVSGARSEPLNADEYSGAASGATR